jgi:hypothetical protein
MFRRVALIAVLVCLAFGGGVLVGHRCAAGPSLWLDAVGQSFLADQYVFTQYQEASYPEAQKALEAYIRYRQSLKPNDTPSWEPGRDPWLDSRGIRFDLTLAWARLALLHERHGNQPAADAAWKHAEAFARQGTWKEPSRAHIRTVIERIDRGQPSAKDPTARAVSGAPNSPQKLARPGFGPAAEPPR